MPLPQLIAHRGYAKHYPENTLPGINAALDAGASMIEVDIQFTADGVPVLLHDATLERTTGSQGRIMDQTLAQLQPIDAGESARLGARFSGTAIPTLAALVALLQTRPGVNVFIELKEESLHYFGIAQIISTTLEQLAPILPRCVLISYDHTCVREARRLGANRIGWVLARYDEVSRQIACRLSPDYLICNQNKLPTIDIELWSGNWRWAAYEVSSLQQALALYRRGVHLVETMSVGELLAELGHVSTHGIR